MSEQLLRYEAVMKEKTESENLKKVVDHQGLKHDTGKQPWFAMPLVVLKPLADVFAAGEKK